MTRINIGVADGEPQESLHGQAENSRRGASFRRIAEEKKTCREVPFVQTFSRPYTKRAEAHACGSLCEKKVPYRTGHSIEVKNEKHQDFPVESRRRRGHRPGKIFVLCTGKEHSYIGSSPRAATHFTYGSTARDSHPDKAERMSENLDSPRHKQQCSRLHLLGYITLLTPRGVRLPMC